MNVVFIDTDTQSDPDFCIVARVEAFIAGWGLDEALKRSEAYLSAGADAILMHSKKSDPSDIESFVKAWNNQVSITLDIVITMIQHCWFVCYLNLFEQVEVLAAIQLMWTCYTHPPIHSQRTATTPGTSSPTPLE